MEPHHNKIVVLDFDHTLFNTTKFVSEIEAYFLDTFGIKAEQFGQTLSYIKGMRTTQDIDTLVEHLPHSDKQAMHTAIFELASRRGVESLHPDVMPFINRHADNFDFLILTFGDQDFQEAKVLGSGLGNLPYKVIQTNKAKEFGPLVKQYRHVYFIDDKPENIDEVKKAYPDVFAYFMKRPNDDPYGEHGKSCERADKEIGNLNFTIE